MSRIPISKTHITQIIDQEKHSLLLETGSFYFMHKPYYAENNQSFNGYTILAAMSIYIMNGDDNYSLFIAFCMNDDEFTLDHIEYDKGLIFIKPYRKKDPITISLEDLMTIFPKIIDMDRDYIVKSGNNDIKVRMLWFSITNARLMQQKMMPIPNHKIADITKWPYIAAHIWCRSVLNVDSNVVADCSLKLSNDSYVLSAENIFKSFTENYSGETRTPGVSVNDNIKPSLKSLKSNDAKKYSIGGRGIYDYYVKAGTSELLFFTDIVEKNPITVSYASALNNSVKTLILNKENITGTNYNISVYDPSQDMSLLAYINSDKYISEVDILVIHISMRTHLHIVNPRLDAGVVNNSLVFAPSTSVYMSAGIINTIRSDFGLNSPSKPKAATIPKPKSNEGICTISKEHIGHILSNNSEYTILQVSYINSVGVSDNVYVRGSSSMGKHLLRFYRSYKDAMISSPCYPLYIEQNGEDIPIDILHNEICVVKLLDKYIHLINQLVPDFDTMDIQTSIIIDTNKLVNYAGIDEDPPVVAQDNIQEVAREYVPEDINEYVAKFSHEYEIKRNDYHIGYGYSTAAHDGITAVKLDAPVANDSHRLDNLFDIVVDTSNKLETPPEVKSSPVERLIRCNALHEVRDLPQNGAYEFGINTEKYGTIVVRFRRLSHEYSILCVVEHKARCAFISSEPLPTPVDIIIIQLDTYKYLHIKSTYVNSYGGIKIPKRLIE
jgi:hypothetical protein